MLKINLLQLENYPIFAQLQLEEALLRQSKENWCITNYGSGDAIVMGLGGDETKLLAPGIKWCPVIRRYSGGGCVLVDENTLFCSFLFQKADLNFCFPGQVMRHMAIFYQNALKLEHWALKENDFTLGDLKCGGNAQYISSSALLQHTSFLWDFDPRKMAALNLPYKTPQYRQNRSNSDFLTALHKFFPQKSDFFTLIEAQLQHEFTVVKQSESYAAAYLNSPHRKTCVLINN